MALRQSVGLLPRLLRVTLDEPLAPMKRPCPQLDGTQ